VNEAALPGSILAKAGHQAQDSLIEPIGTDAETLLAAAASTNS
jgi:hypothetical protein